MYKLYFLPGACSLATLAVLNELNQSVELIDRNSVKSYLDLNPVGSVPLLVDGDQSLSEGAAIMFYLLNQHENDLLPKEAGAQQLALQDIMFANATMHPAYGRLFFIAQNIDNAKGKTEAFNAAEAAINRLWQVVDNRLEGRLFLNGDQPSAADFMLAVYSQWGEYFPVDLVLGRNSERMISAIQSRDSFQKALSAEAENKA